MEDDTAHPPPSTQAQDWLALVTAAVPDRVRDAGVSGTVR